MGRTIAIGDIHGCNKTFNDLLISRLKICKEDTIILLGDYIDKGPDSRGVIDTILRYQELGFHLVTLRGNHEQMLLDSGNSARDMLQWVINGAEPTMESFGVKRFQDMPDKYRSFFKSTQFYEVCKNYIFVHAGLNFEAENIFEDQEAMLWARDFKPIQNRLGSKTMVHGHTPTTIDFILNQSGNCINIDGGCVFYKKRKNMGYLIALILDDMKFVYTKCIDL